MTSAPALRIEQLTFTYPARSRPTLDAVGLTVAAGERVAVLGPNGSGKTTLALHLNGLLRADSGTIDVCGIELASSTLAEIRRRVGLVFQDPDDQLFMNTVAADVAFGPANLGVAPAEREARVTESLAAVGAGELADQHPHRLSGGEKRRVALATVLAMRPDVLVLDEPTSGLDPLGRHRLAELLVALDRAQLIITHDLPFALATCPRAVILAQGRIVADDTTTNLLANPSLLSRHNLELPFGYPIPAVAPPVE